MAQLSKRQGVLVKLIRLQPPAFSLFWFVLVRLHTGDSVLLGRGEGYEVTVLEGAADIIVN